MTELSKKNVSKMGNNKKEDQQGRTGLFLIIKENESERKEKVLRKEKKIGD